MSAPRSLLIAGRDLRVGDVLYYLGEDRTVTSFEDRRTRGVNARVALCGRLQIAIHDDDHIPIVREDRGGPLNA
jgi:hypothetical protein